MNQKCIVNSCFNEIKYKSGSLCNKHYLRFQRHGDPEGGSSFRNTQDWLNSHKNYEGNECLIWPWSRNENGYGSTKYLGKMMVSSRAMCILVHGNPPDDKPITRHLCGKGHLGCVNPNHLEWSDNSTNQLDRIEHGTSNRGIANGQSKINEIVVAEIYSSNLHPKELAKIFYISPTTVYDIKAKRRWKWFTDTLD